MSSRLSPLSLWLINATQDISALPTVCEQAQQSGQAIYVLHRAAQRADVARALPNSPGLIHPIELPEDGYDFPSLTGEEEAELFFLPCVRNIDWPALQSIAPLHRPDCLQPLIAAQPIYNMARHHARPVEWMGWRARAPLARRILREPPAWRGDDVDLIEAIQQWPDPPPWQSIPLHVPPLEDPPLLSPPPLTMDSRVLVVVSFYQCEQWLHACLTSLAQQTRPPDAIAVIDDCSPALPVDFLKPFPNVTLLSTTRNVGPEKILNNIIRATDYDAYMVQDPDDWCSCERLELSLRRAAQTGASIVGTEEFRLDVTQRKIDLCAYPLDVNDAMSKLVSHHLLHGTILIARTLAMKIGGFDEKLKLNADIDFAARAWHAGRVVNLPNYCYYRRVRPGSLTTRVDTGYDSMARAFEEKFTKIRALRNLDLVRAGQPPRIHVEQKEPVGFIYHQGPRLRRSVEAENEAGLSRIEDKGPA